MSRGLLPVEGGRRRCWWCGEHADYIEYHDREWGFPTFDDHRLFEKICLEGFQSGLSWLTILRKREHFREAFADFDFERVARFREGRVNKLLQNAGIVRHRGKIESTINNAKRARELANEFGSLAAFFWSFEPDPTSRPKKLNYGHLVSMSQTPESRELSKALKKRGWSYVGPTTAYAFMQAMGLVNDHLDGCYVRSKVRAVRLKVKPPRV